MSSKRTIGSRRIHRKKRTPGSDPQQGLGADDDGFEACVRAEVDLATGEVAGQADLAAVDEVNDHGLQFVRGTCILAYRIDDVEQGE